MAEEKIVTLAKQKKNLKGLSNLLGGLGFTKISYASKSLTVEKIKGRDLKGKPYLEYRVEFTPKSIEFTFSYQTRRNRLSRLMELMPTFLNILQVAEDYYEVRPTGIFPQINDLFSEFSKMVDRDTLEFSTELSQLQQKYQELNSKYQDLVRSSEANTRILLECERKRDELQRQLDHLTGMSDDLLKESLYNWIKLHSGTIDVREFSRANQVAVTRVEEGLNILIRDGYLRRRFD
ncbi:hypothetical protein GF318_04650 [Candidatus Micrarchaeota archaeon]|nr:hypothetical protein [Candidatus Micrarchaeota archaeon]